MLMGSGFRPANKLFVHGFLTVNGQKMSKSRGTFIKAATYLKYLDPEYLRYYYASKLTGGVEDIDLNLDDFASRVNSELVGKLANLASRSAPMLSKSFDGQIGYLDHTGRELLEKLVSAKEQICEFYEELNYAAAVRLITALADDANRYVEQNQPWATIKTDPQKTQTVLSAIINAVRILTIYLKPVLPRYAEKIEKLLNVNNLSFADIDKLMHDHKINGFERLIDRIEKEKVDAMVDESKVTQAPVAAEFSATPAEPFEPLKPECTIEDFAKMDLRIAKVLKAEAVPGADKLLHLQLDLGGMEKSVFAGIAKAYKPEDLNGKIVVCLANLKPRKMKFGLSEGMILASGPGEKDIFMLTADSGAKPGQTVH